MGQGMLGAGDAGAMAKGRGEPAAFMLSVREVNQASHHKGEA